ncbi:hypothetical protein ACFQX6_67575 [Streptosporangium lutulentum]
MPRIRDRVRTALTGSDRLFSQDTPELVARNKRVAQNLGASGLSWATPNMSALAIAAAADLPEVRWATADRPSASGLIVWDGGIGQVPYRGVYTPVDAISWGPHPDGLSCMMWLSLNRMREAVTALGGTYVPGILPPLLPVGEFVAPITADPYPAEAIDDGARTALTTLASAWLLMKQPKMVDRSSVEIDRSVRRSYGRANLPVPEVTLIDLRRLYVPNITERDEPASRTYNRRWVVGGHWHNQAYGPGWSLRRQIWIPNYIKGPDGAPLIVTERVNVWRR